MLTLMRTNKAPSKARLLKQYLLKEMSEHRIPVGGRIPSERNLIEQFSVSRTTVRQALSELTIQGLIERQQGRGSFRAGRITQLQRGRRSMLVGVWFNWPTGPMYGPIAEGIREELDDWGYHPVLESGGFELGDERRGIAGLVRKELDGFIVAPSWNPRDNHSPLIELIDRQVPVVLVHVRVRGCETDLVSTNSELAAEEVVRHLIGLGHRRIGFIGAGGLSTTDERLRGYRRTMRNHQLPIDEAWLKLDEDNVEDWGQRAAKELLALPADHRPTAVFGFDWYVETITKMARERGLRVPEDLSVVGLDDVSAAPGKLPWLTTYAQPKRQIGQQAARLLMERLQNPSRRIMIILLPGQFVQRDSTAPPPEPKREKG
jgi:DNA-binding LacI/PurR family transcriptional regulator